MPEKTVLIVDDTPENLAIIGALLKPHYHVRAASSGERALRAVGIDPRPDLILLDVMMPGMDGYAVLARLRDDPSTRDIPVVFVTAMDADEDEEHGLELGAVDYITKPIRPAILLARVRTQLELKQARDWLRDQNGYLEGEVARRMRENEIIKDVSLHALATLAEARDNETGNHLRRTSAYVNALARHLAKDERFAPQLGDAAIAMIVKAAPLHDIGKVGIPDSILLKPGKLTAEEFEVMKTHAQIGGEAIASAMRRVLDDMEYPQELARDSSVFAFLDAARQIAAGHHFRLDSWPSPTCSTP